jgi:hypothetical protein
MKSSIDLARKVHFAPPQKLLKSSERIPYSPRTSQKLTKQSKQVNREGLKSKLSMIKSNKELLEKKINEYESKLSKAKLSLRDSTNFEDMRQSTRYLPQPRKSVCMQNLVPARQAARENCVYNATARVDHRRWNNY